MPSGQNTALIRQLIREVWNSRGEAAIERHFDARLREEVTSHWRELFAAFSVAARRVVSGTHDRGAFAGQPPNGRRLSWGSFRFYQIVDGKDIETWPMQDRLGLLQQLGLVPPLGTDVHWAAGAARPQQGRA